MSIVHRHHLWPQLYISLNTPVLHTVHYMILFLVLHGYYIFTYLCITVTYFIHLKYLKSALCLLQNILIHIGLHVHL